jgi:hypothetical protein
MGIAEQVTQSLQLAKTVRLAVVPRASLSFGGVAIL